jgi:hypothetical protein
VYIEVTDPIAVSVENAVRSGDLDALSALLRERPELARAMFGGPAQARSALHIATDWPGHHPRVAQTIGALVAAGADVDARFVGAHAETPLHWAASCDDVAALDALLDAGADVTATGAVVDGGTPLSDAVAFAQWETARRLVERGAPTALWHRAALGLPLGDLAGATAEQLTGAFWHACRGGQRGAARELLDRGADREWVGWDGLTPLEAARGADAHAVVSWLEST